MLLLPKGTFMTTTANTKENKKLKKEFEDLIGPFDPVLDREARDILTSARVALLLKHSFFGNLATRLKLINGDEWLATAATDGKRFYYNSRFIKKLTRGEVEFLVGHEVLHVVYDHIGRIGHRDRQMFNIANDYAVNADLKRHNVGQFITTVPCLYEAKYDGKSSEEIYDDLMKNIKTISMDALIDKMIDEHLEGDGEGESDDDDGDMDKTGRSKNGPKKMTDAEREELRQEIKQNIINAARSSEAGSIPRGVERMIKDITDPKMPWRELLQTNIVSTMRDDYTFLRPSKRGWHLDAILPSMNFSEEIDICVGIDMSGSISDAQGKDFLSEIQGIMDMFSHYKIHVFSFDTKCYNLQEFNSDNMDSITEYELKGGGGTDFDAIFNFLKDEAIEPKRLVVFTDGYPCGSWGDANYCDTTWIIHGDKNPNPPFGTWALYDDGK
jgi:predicted metal-dependent peptidase